MKDFFIRCLAPVDSMSTDMLRQKNDGNVKMIGDKKLASASYK